ncbi:hypothetical protein C465_15312 [Halorubrum distributum JCM 9100]|uniref:Uncharacterized protein n=5 Tax=Halorubrum distributum TaxID=29283 RepID=M0EB49_9EURY|nr:MULTISPECIES: hypothetical protein [Halorubrum distributum group]ELZ31247.1 hypothetical protein C473_11686 [Halorubrum terrestre JCM 10247]ELZ45001.1 hypothetical protein C465_15312 [Halorubrum distributum JCM 9100]ELZ51015.1 hypothetical protein C466_13879 [Halorubrum distributum JCM 10118]EMA60473.1 hypothetical protein C470_09175 [Halorubrum litoreum JCM 13561]MYL16507.1 hypothetical protein [Halorubrum terrestre]
MVSRWACDRCGFVAWTRDRSEMAEVTGSHLLAHHSDALSKSDFRVSWDCPYCATAKTAYDTDGAVAEFKTHLHEHVADRIAGGAHVADLVGWDGVVRVDGPAAGDEADPLRAHFHGAAGLAVAVTPTPERLVRALDGALDAWPRRTVIVSTGEYDFEATPDVDFEGRNAEIVELDPRLSPDEVGETVSRILDANHEPGERISLEVSVFHQIVASFDVERAVAFVRMLAARLDDAGGALQLYVDADADPNVATVLNFLDETIDLRVAVDDGRFVRRP